MNKCKICFEETNYLFSSLILVKYNVKYFHCPNCKFIQTEEPYWLPEAYSKAIAKLDIGLISRNQTYAEILENYFLKNLITSDGIYIDYGGGYGMFVRMMRDKGFNFFRQDIYCENLFAEHFDVSDIDASTTFNLLTAFEVFEHLENPLKEIRQMLSYSDCILFSTLLQPEIITKAESWWYLVPETGQHIALYHHQTLLVIAKKLRLHLYTNKQNLHILSKVPLVLNPFTENKQTLKDKFYNLFYSKIQLQKKESLLQKDFESIKNKISK